MKITLGIPTNRGVKAKTAKSLLELDRLGHEFHVVMATEGYTTAENRNYVAIQALNANSDWLLFVDDDMIFPPETLRKMLETGKEVVGVNSNSRTLPLSSTVAPIDENGRYKPLKDFPEGYELPKELFECHAVGGGVLLIKTEVLKVVGRPWFDVTTTELGKILMGEDAWFCSLAREKGYKIWCEGSIQIGHIGDYTY